MKYDYRFIILKEKSAVSVGKSAILRRKLGFDRSEEEQSPKVKKTESQVIPFYSNLI